MSYIQILAISFNSRLTVFLLYSDNVFLQEVANFSSFMCFLQTAYKVWFFYRSSTTTTWCPPVTPWTSALTRPIWTKRCWRTPWRRRRLAFWCEQNSRNGTSPEKTSGFSKSCASKLVKTQFCHSFDNKFIVKNHLT